MNDIELEHFYETIQLSTNYFFLIINLIHKSAKYFKKQIYKSKYKPTINTIL